MSNLQLKTIEAIKRLDEGKLKKVSKFIVLIEKNNVPNDDTIESFLEGEELLNNPNTKCYNNIKELKEALGV